MIYRSRSIQGRAREENRDFAGASYDRSRGLFVVADGTSRPGSGLPAQALVEQLMHAYQARVGWGAEDHTHSLASELIQSVLSDLHGPLFDERTGSASYMAAVVSNGRLTIAYEGDCCCGLADGHDRITWINPPHCVANWKADRLHRDLAQDPARNKITRCLRGDRAPAPAIMDLAVAPGDRLIFATDGFWAELSDARQSEAIATTEIVLANVDDDVTWIDVRL